MCPCGVELDKSPSEERVSASLSPSQNHSRLSGAAVGDSLRVVQAYIRFACSIGQTLNPQLTVPAMFPTIVAAFPLKLSYKESAQARYFA
jgi:hypothetical protein